MLMDDVRFKRHTSKTVNNNPLLNVKEEEPNILDEIISRLKFSLR
jgi:hypothetical protein